MRQTQSASSEPLVFANDWVNDEDDRSGRVKYLKTQNSKDQQKQNIAPQSCISEKTIDRNMKIQYFVIDVDDYWLLVDVDD